jgi:hypothetical protein
MIRRSHVVVLGAILSCALVTACTDNPVGRICDLGSLTPAPSEVVVASPSLDCVSRTCLRQPLQKELPAGSAFPSGNSGLCTAECSSDSDCDRVPESPCTGGFTCAIATTVGPFCCQKFCICKDYIVIPDTGKVPTQKACEPSDMNNKCRNLPGR